MKKKLFLCVTLIITSILNFATMSYAKEDKNDYQIMIQTESCENIYSIETGSYTEIPIYSSLENSKTCCHMLHIGGGYGVMIKKDEGTVYEV